MRVNFGKIGFAGSIIVILGIMFFSQVFITPDAQAADKATMQLHWKASGMHVPFILAWDKGFFKEQGIDMTVKEGAGSSATLKLIAAGKETFGMAGTNVVVKGIIRGMPILQVAQVEVSKQYCLLYKPEAGISTPNDLKGKIIAGSGSGGTTALWEAFLAVNKISKKDVTYLNAGRARLEAMATDRAHGVLGLGLDDPSRLETMGVKSPQVMLFADWGIPDIGDGIIVNQKTIKENPDLIRRFIKAYIKGINYTFMDIEGSADIAVKRFPLAKKDILIRQMKKLQWVFPPPLGWQNPKSIEGIRDITAEFDGLPQAANMPLSKFYTNEFVPKY